MNAQFATHSLETQPTPIKDGGGFIGQSTILQDLLDQATRVANTDCRILLMGESGTGMESLARAIHEKSHRRHNPFLKINCAPMTEDNIGCEGIGLKQFLSYPSNPNQHEWISFINGGSLYIDDVGELSSEEQAKLLGLLAHIESEPLDSVDSSKLNIRIIAATRRDLYADVKENRFRADLFYRLNVLPLRIPPLRERKDDLPSLVQYFLTKYNRKHRKSVKSLSQEALLKLCQYSWPGNVHELKTIIERAVILSKGDVLDERLLIPSHSTFSVDALMSTFILQSGQTFENSWVNSRSFLHI